VEFVRFSKKKGVVLRRQLDRRWKARALLPVFVLAAGSLLLAGCSSTAASAPCTLKQLTLTLEQPHTSGPATTLPPSRDNDAGEGRIPDTHPDADVDANQRKALCQVYRSEHHLPG
jgi:hypothetical protein